MKRPYNWRTPATPDSPAVLGSRWIDRDPRGKGRIVVVMEPESMAQVKLKNEKTGRVSQIAVERFHKQYSCLNP